MFSPGNKPRAGNPAARARAGNYSPGWKGWDAPICRAGPEPGRAGPGRAGSQ